MSDLLKSCEAIETARRHIVLARELLADLGRARSGYKDQFKDVEGLLTCGLVVTADIRDQMIRNDAANVARSTTTV